MSRLILPRRALLKAGAAALITSPAIIGKAAAQLGGGLMFPGPGTAHSTGGSAFLWDPASNAGVVTANGNRDATGATTTSFQSIRTVSSFSSGKLYLEGKVTVFNTSNHPGQGFGFCDINANMNAFLGNSPNGGMYYIVLNQFFSNGTFTQSATGPSVPSIALNTIPQWAMDATLGRGWIGFGGTWITGDPSTNTDPTLLWTAGSTIFFGMTFSDVAANSDTISLPASTSLTVPTGYTAVNA